ncbi:hypothetical protein Poli38472_014823 [Pythium oligandrum]|uniref:Uncharacterized protein n=1 Tax=Pythium oligandrum TaxID=41045 RepID=A0A8K1FMR7_PYTOL|nr:hypothetical protein Poli38472_014823 [Pythium oligandrum]|eukprot:TMW63913.1 hypothetical protein Poli38472_014823 [Pythium oligandrum]
MLATTTTTTTMYHVPPTEVADAQARTSADTNSASDTFTFTDTFTDTDASTATYDGSQRRSPKLPVRSTAFEMRKMLFWRPIQLELVASNCERDCATNITAMSADADADAETEANANAATSINQQVKLYCRSTTFRCAPAKVFDFRGPNAGAIRIRTKPEKMEISVAFTTRLHKLRLRTDSPEEYEKWFYLFIRSDSNLVMEIPPHLAIKTDTKAEAHQHSVTQVHRTVTFNDNVDVRYIQYQDQHVQDIQDVQESEHDAVALMLTPTLYMEK